MRARFSLESVNNTIKIAIGLALTFVGFIVSAGILLALNRRGFRPAEAIARFLSPDSVVSLSEG